MILSERKRARRLGGRGLLGVIMLALCALPLFAQQVEGPAGGVAAGPAVTGCPLSADDATGAKRVSRPMSLIPQSSDPNAALPEEARALMQRFDEQQRAIRREVEQTLIAQRAGLIQQMRDLLDRTTRAGQLDQAIAIRDCIRQLEGGGGGVPGAVGGIVRGDPVDLVRFRGKDGQSFCFNIVGRTDGPVWGTDVYTDDSTLAVAAVHAGVARPGQPATVRVTILPPRDHYDGSTRNGVTTMSYDQWYGSFRVEPAENVAVTTPAIAPPFGEGCAGAAALPDPGTLTALRDKVGQRFLFEVVGSTTGTIWGSGIYTDDSPLAVTVVHAGLLSPGQRGKVRVLIEPGRDSYPGTTQFGVTSMPYGPFPGSYRVEAASFEPVMGSRNAIAPPGVPAPPGFPAPPTSLQDFRGRNGMTLVFGLTGSTQGIVWGSDVYTDDSSLAAAAVHAGALADGESGLVRLTIAPGCDSYAGSTRNGVTSRPWSTPWPGSFRIERAAPPAPAGPVDLYAPVLPPPGLRR